MSRIKIIKKNSQNINKELKIGFWDNYLGERGTTVALFDYAYYNQKLLNNKSIIFNNIANNSSVPRVVEKFKKEFPVFDVNEFSGAEEIIKKEAIDVLYVIKSGEKDNRISRYCKTVIHCVFSCFQPHGNIYSSIAPWVKGNGGKYPFVPHMINLPKHDKDMRKELSIPEEAVVFGRHGGYNQFDINFVKKIIIRNFANNMKYYFVFVNTKPFHHAKNIIYLDKIIDLEEKVRFINTCDAMLWGRSDGEVFSLSMGEFSSKNKPIICKKVGYDGHIHKLRDNALWYKNPKDLLNILENFDKEEVKKKDWNCYKEDTPEKVMEIFNKVFIKPFDKSNFIEPNKGYTPDTLENNKELIKKITKKRNNLSKGWEKMTKNLKNYLESGDIDMYKINNVEPHIFHWPENSIQNRRQFKILSKNKNSKFYQSVINNINYGPKGIKIVNGVQMDRVQQIWSIYNLVEILKLNLNNEKEIILEFGGGTGQMADVLKDLKFQGIHIVYDLPLMTVLQKYFVEKRNIKTNYILDDEELKILKGTNYLPCNQTDKEIKIMELDNINFVATYSLSETDLETHEKFYGYMKNFSRIFIIYSLNQTETEDYIDNHSYILKISKNIETTHKILISDNFGNGKVFYAVRKNLLEGEIKL